MIDEKGKIFGKINIIDFIVLVVLVAAVGVGAYAKLANKSLFPSQRNEDQTLVMKYYLEEVSDFVTDKVVVGASLLDDNEDVNLGKVTAFEINPSVSFVGNAQGEFVRSTKEGFNSILITGEVNGKKTEYGAEIEKIKYGVGHSLVLRAGDAKLYLRVYDIQILESPERN